MEEYESKVESKVAKDALLKYGVFSIKIKSAQERSYPDRLFLIPGGKPLFIEFKRQGEDPDSRQELIHERLRYAGYDVQVHDRHNMAMAAIKAALDAAHATSQIGGTWNQLLKRRG